MINNMSLILLTIYLFSHIYKITSLERKKIKVFILGQGHKRSSLIENLVKFLSIIMNIFWFFLNFHIKNLNKISYLGFFLSIIGLVFIIVAMFYMKTSWRVGIDYQSKQNLVTEGIYNFSRNPTYVGMHIMYLGVFFTYLNFYFLILTILNIIALHFLIKKEEIYLINSLGNEYTVYFSKVNRYF